MSANENENENEREQGELLHLDIDTILEILDFIKRTQCMGPEEARKKAEEAEEEAEEARKKAGEA